MDKWVKNGFEHRYESSGDSGQRFVIRIEHTGALLSGYVLVWQYSIGRYWSERQLGDRFATLRQAKDYAALLGVTA